MVVIKTDAQEAAVNKCSKCLLDNVKEYNNELTRTEESLISSSSRRFRSLYVGCITTLHLFA